MFRGFGGVRNVTDKVRAEADNARSTAFGNAGSGDIHAERRHRGEGFGS